jgi:hypothetical protein
MDHARRLIGVKGVNHQRRRAVLYEGATPFSDGTGTSEIFEFDVLGLDVQDSLGG